jgi:hypothetical protein
MDETLRFHSGWHDRLCLTRAGRRVQRSVNHVWKPVVSSLWAIPGPPLPDTWHRAAPEVLHAPASVSLRRLRVARVVQSRRVRAASVAAHAPAGPLNIRAVSLRSRAVRPGTTRFRRNAPDIGRTRSRGPDPHGRGFGADVRTRPTRPPSSGGGLIAVATSTTRRRWTEQADQQHDKREKHHRSTQAPVTDVAAWHGERRREDWCLWRQCGLAERAGFCARDDDRRAARAAHVTIHRIRWRDGHRRGHARATLGSVARQSPVL